MMLFFRTMLTFRSCHVNRLTIVQAKLIDDKQKLLQGAGGKFGYQFQFIVYV